MDTAITVHIPTTSQVLPDNAAYCNRFEVKSQTSNSVYIIAQSKKGRWWSCECPGWRRHRTCKHMKSVGLPCGQVPFEARLAAPGAK